MKRLTAICFLCLLLFNIAGYRLWFYYAERQATAQLVASVEQEQYNAAELLTLSVPLTLPYQTDWHDWEQVRGEIEIEGIVYQYVQRKVEQGQMILQCLPNKQKAQLASARDRFFELANSFQADNTHKKEAPAKTFKVTKPSLTDFDDNWSAWRLAIQHLPLEEKRSFVVMALPSLLMPVNGQPPKRIA